MNTKEEESKGARPITEKINDEVLFSGVGIIGKETGLPLPRFVILKSNKTNLRQGPGLKYATNWIYERKGYPMLVIAEFENWRKLKDIDGQEGWVNEKLVTGKRHVLLIGNKLPDDHKYDSPINKEVILLRYPNEASYPMARIEIGVLGEVLQCSVDWCKVKVGSYRGWIHKVNLWGVLRDEVIK